MTNDELIGMVRKSAADLIEAARGLGDNVTWSVQDKGRSAADQLAECTLLTGMTVGILTTKMVPPVDMEGYRAAVAPLTADPHGTIKALADHTQALTDAIAKMSPEDHSFTVTMPWGNPMTLSEVVMLIYWNNTYHLGQINFISALV
jgi:hypothetical protein